MQISTLLRYLIGVMFLVSGVSKMFPVESFALILVSQGIADWSYAPALARVIIAFELMLGLSFFQSNYLKSVVLPAAFSLLLVFSLHMLYLIVFQGETDNCGCFGELIPMTPLESLLKNLLFIGVVVFVYRKSVERRELNLKHLSIPLAAVIIVLLLAPPGATNEAEQSAAGESVIGAPAEDLPPILRFSDFTDAGQVNLAEGPKMIAVFSLDCEHCRASAADLKGFSEEGILPEFYALFFGEPEMIEEFFSEAGFRFPYRMIEMESFFMLLRSSPPRIVLSVDGEILGDWDYDNYDANDIRNALEQI